MKHLLTAVFAAVSVVWPCLGRADNALSLHDVVARARERAPAIIAARATIEEARGRLIGASVFLHDNPEIDGDAGARFVEHGELLEGSIGVRQLFETGGRRAARIASANAALEGATATSADVTRRVVRDAAVAFWTAIHAAERRRLTEQAVALAEETLRIARRRYQSGDIGILDVNVAETALARARAQVYSQTAESDAAVGVLRMLLGMEQDEPLALRGDLRDRPLHEMTDLLAHAAERPDVQALAAQEREAVSDGRLGRALEWPALGIGARYERDDGKDVALGNVTVVVPLFEHGQGLRVEAAAREHRARSAVEATRRNVRVEVQTALEVYRRREQAVIELEGNALPGLDANETLSRRSYEVGQISLPELLGIRREILETKSEYLSRLLEAAIAAVDVEASAGVLP